MKKVVLITLGIFSFNCLAQQKSIPPADLVQTAPSIPVEEEMFSKASAVVLNEEGGVDFEFSEESGFAVVQKVKRLIQINTKEGIAHASLLLPYYVNRYTTESVEIDSYKIYRTTQGKEEVIEVKAAENRFVHDGLYSKEIIVNDIRIGDRIAYSYTKKIDNIDVIPTWYFQGDIPKLQSSYTVNIPDNLTYFLTKTGGLTLRETKTVTETARDLARNKWGTSYRYKEAILGFQAKAVPAFENEPFSINAQQNISSVRFDLIQFQYPMSPSVVIPHEKEAVAKEIYKDRKFGNELKQDKYWNKTLEHIDLSGLNAMEKAQKVIAYVQQHIKWDQHYGYWTDKGVKRAMSQGQGNSADLNLALIGALRAAGFQANPIVLSTQSNGVAPILFTRFLNHVIVGLQIEDQFYVLDGTMEDALLNVLPFEDLNGYGWMITDKFSVTQVDLTPRQISFKQEEFQLTLDESGHATGTMKGLLTRYEALAFKSNYAESMLNRSRSDIEGRSSQLFLSHGEIKLTENKDIDLGFQVRKFNFATVDPKNNTLTFTPLELYRDKANPFENPVRQTDIHFLYPFMDMYKLVVQLPEGYRLKYYPKDEVFANSKIGANMIYEVKVLEGNQLQIGLSLRLQKTVIPKEDYGELRLLYAMIQQQIKEHHVVLERIK
ncbi:DUF3857 and transglutaminase domain-containing protein [Myroides sp. NP-2]|uniref:DUF3857 and transglutaminase domain-containing protein n=1 Tax=Myroides sp. NP-2 TaxID=2759945 RepID=UPI0015F909B1|nr:DUF3857 and transglutaminase domain-containing protein [Myroides sp. NP-2]MBB1148854.1 DUF3857 and transglutaminase domain-containing protein [Myroides sp. NP-2]